MGEHGWTEVDDYIERKLIGDAGWAEAVMANNAEAELAPIDVSPTYGKLLHILVRISRARRVLEIGTLGGYSTIWMAKALPEGGRILTIEVDPNTAQVARGNFAQAGVADRIDSRIGAALDVLPGLEGPFDLVFIDADKVNNARYAEWAVKLGRPGTVIVCDNVVRDGGVLDAETRDPMIVGTRALFDYLGGGAGLTATAIQTVGRKKWDGFAIAVVD